MDGRHATLSEQCEFKEHVMPKVSAVIPCYNHGQYIDEAVDSILKQTYQDVEIIVRIVLMSVHGISITEKNVLENLLTI